MYRDVDGFTYTLDWSDSMIRDLYGDDPAYIDEYNFWVYNNRPSLCDVGD
jgi:hypothetical protein